MKYRNFKFAHSHVFKFITSGTIEIKLRQFPKREVLNTAMKREGCDREGELEREEKREGERRKGREKEEEREGERRREREKEEEGEGERRREREKEGERGRKRRRE